MLENELKRSCIRFVVALVLLLGVALLALWGAFQTHIVVLEWIFGIAAGWGLGDVLYNVLYLLRLRRIFRRYAVKGKDDGFLRFTDGRVERVTDGRVERE
jgi:hypothetical protein